MGDHGVTPNNFVIITLLDEEEASEDCGSAIGLQTNFSEQEYSGVISGIVLTSQFIEIFISKEEIEKVGVSQIKATFDPSQIDLGELANYLHQIFDKSNVALGIEF